MKRLFLQSSKRLAPFLLAITFAISLAACGGEPSPTPTPTPKPAAPTLSITAPQAGATIPAGDVTVSINVSNFNLIAPGQPNAAGQGHVHYYMDVDAPTTPGQPAVTAQGTYAASPNTSSVWKAVTPGSHTFSAQLVNNNHTPLEPPVVAKVTVTVQAAAAAAPSLTITAPQAGASIPAGDVTVSINVSNFNLIAPGQPNAAGQGHVHYYKDVDAPTTPGQPAVTAQGTYAASPTTSNVWKAVTPGSHTFSAQLVNNNHTPLEPPVVAKVTVTVQAAAAAAPSLTITAPQAGASIPAGDVTVSINVSNFNVVSKLSQANASGEGHVHYYKDVDAPTTPGQPAVTAQGTYAVNANTSNVWTNITPGSHTFSVQLVNNNHTPLEPPVVAKVSVTVQAPAASPPPTAGPAGPAYNMTLTASGFAYDKGTITVPAGSLVKMNFVNNDASFASHNFALYTDSTATTPIFQGALIAGGNTTTYTFGAPLNPGTYFYRCDAHALTMTGSFVVTAS